MKKYFKSFLFYGFLSGFLIGIGLVIYPYFIAPGIPGIYEIGIQLLITIVLGILFLFDGLILWLVCFGGEALYRRYIKTTTK